MTYNLDAVGRVNFRKLCCRDEIPNANSKLLITSDANKLCVGHIVKAQLHLMKNLEIWKTTVIFVFRFLKAKPKLKV